MSMLSSMEHSWLTDMDLLFSSPGLYSLKKLAGRLSRRIIMDASMPRDSFVCSLLCRSPLTLVRSWVDRDTQTMQMATPIRAVTCPLSRTGPVKAFVSRGMISPTSEMTVVNTVIIMVSL